MQSFISFIYRLSFTSANWNSIWIFYFKCTGKYPFSTLIRKQFFLPHFLRKILVPWKKRKLLVIIFLCLMLLTGYKNLTNDVNNSDNTTTFACQRVTVGERSMRQRTLLIALRPTLIFYISVVNCSNPLYFSLNHSSSLTRLIIGSV